MKKAVTCLERSTPLFIMILVFFSCLPCDGETPEKSKSHEVTFANFKKETDKIINTIHNDKGICHDDTIRKSYLKKLNELSDFADVCIKKCKNSASPKVLAFRQKKILINDKIKWLKHLKCPVDCAACDTIENCKAACEEWKSKSHKYWENELPYKQFIALDRNGFDCHAAVEELENYYQIIAPKSEDASSIDLITYDKEDIQALLLTIYPILSTNNEDCSDKGLEIIQKILFLSPGLETLIKDCLDLLDETDSNTLIKILIHKIKELDPDTQEKLYQAIDKSDNHALWNIFSFVQILNNKFSKKNRDALIKILSSLKWDQMTDIIKEINSIDEKGMKGIVEIELFRRKTTSTEYDENINQLVECLPNILKKKMGYDISMKEKNGNNGRSAIMQNTKVGSFCTQLASEPNKNGNIMLRIAGGISSEKDFYRLWIRFFSNKGFLLFSKDLTISKTEKDVCACFTKKFEETYAEFYSFVSLFQLFPATNTQLDRIQAYIVSKSHINQYSVKQHTASGNIEEFNGILIKKGFWEDKNGPDLFGNAFHDDVLNRINTHYFHTKLNTYVEDKIKSGYMLVSGEYGETYDTQNGVITIFFSDSSGSKKNYREVNLTFSKQLIKETEKDYQIKELKNEVVNIITTHLANIFDLKPKGLFVGCPKEPTVLEKKCAEMQKDWRLYAKSFCIPGYARTYCDAAPSGKVKIWNLSNAVIASLSLASAMIYINSDEEEDWSYTVAAIGGYALCLNGGIGVWDAYRYKKKHLSVQLNYQHQTPVVMVSLNF